ncbi:MAG TPA: DHH family phosphoesterase [Thermoplasmatales archaeon]|nr:DHH family phosphoesterase [Thermoplasmatales archaeon]
MKPIEVKGKTLVVHHWDADGVCSASLLLNHLDTDQVKTMTPTIGNYFLSENEMRFCRGFDHVFIVDMALPEENVKELAFFSTVTVFDHHFQKPIEDVNHVNPVAYGKPQQSYPSATWVLKEYFDDDVTLPVVLGVVGDNEHKIKDNKRFSTMLDGYCRGHSLSFDDLLRMVYLIDSNYKMQKKEEVERIPWLLMRGDVEEVILGNVEWNRNVKVLEDEINQILSDETLVTEKNNVVVMSINTPYNIISTVTRRFAWETGKNVVVVNKGFFDDKDQLYVRSSNVDLTSLINKAKNSGFHAGGKNNVMGVVVPKSKTEGLIDEVVSFFGGEKA